MYMVFDILPGEVFYGGAVTDGIKQPYTQKSVLELDLSRNQTPNQLMPLLLSTAGRWLWNPEGMRVSFCEGRVQCSEGTILRQTKGGLRQAYLDAMGQCFPFHDIRLDGSLFQRPIYNTWIELTFNQTQEGVLKYAHSVLEHGMPPSILMIDDGWSNTYGNWSFSAERFPSPKKMLEELHQLGFKVMMWICPFITPDTLEYRDLEKAGLLVTDEKGQPHIAHWWNGWSAVLDMTQPEACNWLKTQLDELQVLGVDGFKFDAGDSIYYPEGVAVSGGEHSRAWAAFGEQYPLNEFRVTDKAGGWSLMQRLCDKDHDWGNSGLAALIPDAIVQSITGHPFLCPDMIGGGEYRNFYDRNSLDNELVVRWAQIACLMPVMQFSAAPWRILSKEDYTKVQLAVALREHYKAQLQEAIEQCRAHGEPILRPMAYEFADEACSTITDQFMLGNTLLVAPVLQKGATRRMVYLPTGCWRTHCGQMYNSKGEYFDMDIGDGLDVYEQEK